MLWQVFILLVATAAASDDGDDSENQIDKCVDLMYHECEPEDGKRPDFPGNAEELEEACKFGTKRLDCQERVLSSCEEDVNHILRTVRETAAAVRRVCHEDPVLRTALGAVLPCVKGNVERIGRCGDSFNLDQESFNEAINELELEEIEDLDDSGRRCLSILYGMGCTAATTGLYCGDVARDIMVNIMQGLDQPFESCPAGVKDQLPEIVKLVQIEIEKAESVVENLKKKK